MQRGTVPSIQFQALQFLPFFLPPCPALFPRHAEPTRSHSALANGGASPTFHLIRCSGCPPSKPRRESHGSRETAGHLGHSANRGTTSYGQSSPATVRTVSKLSPLTGVTGCNRDANEQGARLKAPRGLAISLIRCKTLCTRGAFGLFPPGTPRFSTDSDQPGPGLFPALVGHPFIRSLAF